VDLSWMSGKGVPVDERHVYRGNGNAICRIALTSGSTGEAKAVGFTHNNQLARLARYNHVFGNAFPKYSRFFSDYGLGSSGGFRHLLYVLSRGGTMFFPGASPMDTLQTFALYKVQGLIASPGGLSGFLTFYDANSDFRCGFDIILSAGSPLPDSLSQRVRARMCSNLIFYYGTTETSTIASAPAHALAGAAGAVGYVTPDVSVQIVDENGTSLPARKGGAVRVRTPVNVLGYLDGLVCTQKARNTKRLIDMVLVATSNPNNASGKTTGRAWKPRQRASPRPGGVKEPQSQPEQRSLASRSHVPRQSRA
jgi:acyl-coenzyme A synthetase/AMP-(fatty) acid ligase